MRRRTIGRSTCDGSKTTPRIENRDDHSDAENLYLAFAEPTAHRLAAEWNMPVAEVQRRLAARGLKQHANQDLYFMGEEFTRKSLYKRSEVDPLAPYAVVRGPTDNREPSADEPNLLN